MKKNLYVIWIFIFVVTLLWAGPSLAQKKFLTLASGSPGGVYYPLGGGMAVAIQKTTDLRCAAESTGASVENCRLVGAAESDMGMVMGSIAYKAIRENSRLKKNSRSWLFFKCILLPNTLSPYPGRELNP